MKIKNVLIVGGGSSGWMTAAAFVKQFPELNVTLVESKKIGIIGVGESTLGHFNGFLHFLGLKDKDFMKFCNATYKNSIKFTDFREKDSVFHYPFGSFNMNDKPEGLMTYAELKTYWPDLYPPETFARMFNSNTYIAEAGKQTFDEEGHFRGFNFKADTAYHFDTYKFGEYLREVYCKNKITHIYDDVLDAEINDDGSLRNIVCKESGLLEADLFIDCTGFKSFLLEEKMNSKYISFNNVLMNDSAMAAHIEYNDIEKEMENTTDCTAIENGWCWNIPLWNRIGAGYVYSSKFVTKEQAEIEFKSYLQRKGKNVDNLKINHIDIRHGKREKAWIKNVVGIGLSYGFIEPLESTGLLTTHENILRMMDILTMTNCNVKSIDIAGFNYSVNHSLETLKNFVAQHYALSSRDDTEYWKYVTNNIDYDDGESVPYTVNGITCFKPSEHIHTSQSLINFWDTNLNGAAYILAGMGYVPATDRYIKRHRETRNKNQFDLMVIKEKLEQYDRYAKQQVEKLPSHYQFLKENIYD